MELELRPPEGAAGIRIGTSRHDALARCAELGEVSDFRRGSQDSVSLSVARPSGLMVFVYFDDAELVNAVELGRPEGDDEAVVYEGVNMFDTQPDEIVACLRERTPVVESEGGCSFIAPDLLVALWRPFVPEGDDDDEGRYFESVLVARPGYYAT